MGKAKPKGKSTDPNTQPEPALGNDPPVKSPVKGKTPLPAKSLTKDKMPQSENSLVKDKTSLPAKSMARPKDMMPQWGKSDQGQDTPHEERVLKGTITDLVRWNPH